MFDIIQNKNLCSCFWCFHINGAITETSNNTITPQECERNVSTKNTERIGIYLPPKLKEDIKRMADETGYSVNQLSLMALTSLVANYEDKNMFIFTELIMPKK